MSQIFSISVNKELGDFIEGEVSSGEYESKGQVVKRALHRLRRDTILNRIAEASMDARVGKVFRGDLREIAEKFKTNKNNENCESLLY